MRLLCNIQPRRNGTVNCTGPSGTVYVFSADEAGDLVADVTDDADATYLLDLPGDRFEPADEADFVKAEQLLAAKKAAESDPDEDDDEDDDEDADPNAPPIEAGTPPKPPKPKAPGKGKGKPAAAA